MKYITALLLFFAISAHACEDCDHTPPEQKSVCAGEEAYGQPKFGKQNVQRLCRNGYVSYFDKTAKIPLFVAYTLSPDHAVGCLGRDSFKADPEVGSIPTPKDYAKSSYDIGHNANAADLAYSAESAEDAALITNMSPQAPGFNRGIWKKLEDGTRGWALSRKHTIQVYVLNLVDYKQDPVIGENHVKVPHAMSKVLIDTNTKDAMVFLFNNEGSKKPLASFMTSLAELQKQSGVIIPMPKDVKYSGMWKVDMKSARTVKQSVCKVNQ